MHGRASAQTGGGPERRSCNPPQGARLSWLRIFCSEQFKLRDHEAAPSLPGALQQVGSRPEGVVWGAEREGQRAAPCPLAGPPQETQLWGSWGNQLWLTGSTLALILVSSEHFPAGRTPHPETGPGLVWGA